MQCRMSMKPQKPDRMQPKNYLMVLPVRHFRLDEHRVAVESAFAEHLLMMRRSLGDKAHRLVIASPTMKVATSERRAASLSTIDEAIDAISFSELFSDDAAGATLARLWLFWPVLRRLHPMVKASLCVHSGLSGEIRLPFEFAAIVLGLLL